MTSSWYRHPGFFIAAGIFVVALSVYCLTISDQISFWDCGEFTTASHILGVPHQPGTPLYVLVGRVFDILVGSASVDEPAMRTAWAINFMSAFFSSLALVFVYLIVTRVARRADADSGWMAHVGGVVGALFLLFSDTFWNNAIEAEVYGLAAFIISFLAWVSLRWYEVCENQRSDRLYLLIIYMLALGVGFHLGSILVYPGIFVLMLVARERRLPLVDLLGMSVGLGIFLLSTMINSRTGSNAGPILLNVLLVAFFIFVIWRRISGRTLLLYGSMLFLVGLSVHLFLLLRAPLEPAINQSNPDTFEKLLAVIRREQYPPMSIFDRQAPLAWQFGYYYDFFLRQFTFLSGSGMIVTASTFLGPIFLGLLGIFHGIRRARPVIWMLITNYLINGEGLTLYLNFTDHEVRERDYFYFAAFMFFAMFIGIGVAALLRYAAGPEGKSAGELGAGEKTTPVRAGWLARGAAVLLIVVAVWPAVQPAHSKWFDHDRTGDRVAYEYAWNILAGLDENAILFTNGDNDTFPIWYLQEVEHFRRDVTVVNLSLINLKWYIRQLRDAEAPIPLSYSDTDLDKIQPYWAEDPKTGERRIVYVRDFIVSDIVRKNARDSHPRSVFFAVTIPRENMEDFYPFLQMEGLIYRLRYEKSETGNPEVDRQRLLDNMLGKYDFSGLMTGDNERRRTTYREARSWMTDSGDGRVVAGSDTAQFPFDEVIAFLGSMRRDIYMDRNTVNLLGNYPAALARAGLLFAIEFDEMKDKDSPRYKYLLGAATACYDAAVAFDPWFPTITDIYAMILVENDRYQDALDYVDRLPGHVDEKHEDRIYRDLGALFLEAGQVDMFMPWLENRIDKEPGRKIFYHIGFLMNEAMHRPDECESFLRRWEEQSGTRDAGMAARIEQERRRIEAAVRQGMEED